MLSEAGQIDFKEFLWARIHFTKDHADLDNMLDSLFEFFDSDGASPATVPVTFACTPSYSTVYC